MGGGEFFSKMQLCTSKTNPRHYFLTPWPRSNTPANTPAEFSIFFVEIWMGNTIQTCGHQHGGIEFVDALAAFLAQFWCQYWCKSVPHFGTVLGRFGCQFWCHFGAKFGTKSGTKMAVEVVQNCISNEKKDTFGNAVEPKDLVIKQATKMSIQIRQKAGFEIILNPFLLRLGDRFGQGCMACIYQFVWVGGVFPIGRGQSVFRKRFQQG